MTRGAASPRPRPRLSLSPPPFLVLVLVLVFSLAAARPQQPPPVTRAEAQHLGLEYSEPAIVTEFRASSTFLNSAAPKVNDFMPHHRLLEDFCLLRSGGCTWWQYYRLLDDVLRKPYEHLFDPGQRTLGEPLEHILDAEESLEGCVELHEEPSAGEFWEYVKQSRPVIIRGGNTSNRSTWSLHSLEGVFGEKPIVVSASPSSDFDGPEDPALWGLSKDDLMDAVSGTDNEIKANSKEKNKRKRNRKASVSVDGKEIERLISVPSLIVRPAHIHMLFKEYVQMLRQPASNLTHSNFYLEYFPLSALLQDFRATGNMDDKLGKGRQDLQDNIPVNKFANFLSQRYHLLWLSGGGHDSSSKPTSRLHFDRMENLMTVVSGEKQFWLYPPSQSAYLHAGEPCFSASFTATVTRSSSYPTTPGRGSISSIQFSRNKSNINFEVNRHHTYAPVNIRRKNYHQFPKLSKARGFECTVRSGDTLYVPAHWWHEVASTSDEEGTCVAVNRFFEPLYIRPQHNTTLNYFQTSRYYGHLQASKRAQVCDLEEVCFAAVNYKVEEVSSSAPQCDHTDEEGSMGEGRNPGIDVRKRRSQWQSSGGEFVMNDSSGKQDGLIKVGKRKGGKVKRKSIHRRGKVLRVRK